MSFDAATPDTLRALGYTCAQAAPVADEDGDPVPLWVVYAPDGRQFAYSDSEARAWQAAIEILRYRGLMTGEE